MKTSPKCAFIKNWKVLHVLVSFVFISSLFHNADAKSIANPNTINTSAKKQLPFYASPNYGSPDTFGSDGRFLGNPYEFQGGPYTANPVHRRIGESEDKRQKVPGWWGRRNAIEGNKDVYGHAEDKRQKVPGWWGRRDTIDGNKDFYAYDEDKRQKVPGWWGRRDTIDGNKDLYVYDENKRQKELGDWWGRRDTIDGNKDLYVYDENKRQEEPGWWWGRRDTIDGNKDLYVYDEHKRQKEPGEWWGRRDTIVEKA